MKVAIVRFPGTNCDLDTYHVLFNVLGADTSLVWHEGADLGRYDAIVLPGGFSYGDHLRAGVIAAYSPAVQQVVRAARDGKPVLGICNGFQILVEAGLLPGALLRNSNLRFVCRWVNLRVEDDRNLFTSLSGRRSIVRMPIAHNEGRYYVDQESLQSLERNGRIVFRYVDEKGFPSESANPNGSVSNIAGVCNSEGNVLGLMPHPERASEPLLNQFGSSDGLQIFRSMLRFAEVVLKR